MSVNGLNNSPPYGKGRQSRQGLKFFSAHRTQPQLCAESEEGCLVLSWIHDSCHLSFVGLYPFSVGCRFSAAHKVTTTVTSDIGISNLSERSSVVVCRDEAMECLRWFGDVKL